MRTDLCLKKCPWIQRFMQRCSLVLLFLFMSILGINSKSIVQHSLQKRWSQASLSFNDPEFSHQYYLSDDLMNIHKTWDAGITGAGVTICVNDPTGVDYNHPELRRRFRFDSSFNFKTNGSHPTPEFSRLDKSHGTMMAGLAAAEANNANCGVGVAFSARISGINLDLQDSGTGWDFDRGIAKSLEHRYDINDIYSNSWGLILPLQTNIGYIHPWIKEAMRRTAENGRQGKGSIIVFSAGNGGLLNGTCSYDELISSIYTIGISVITGRNTMSLQNVKCAGIMAVTYGRDGMDGIDNTEFQMPSPALNSVCSKAAASSSASAAVASGIFALVLQANQNLTWRDVQHLVVHSSSSHFDSVKWSVNGAGFKVNDGFGFGALDAKALTDNARIWKNVKQQLNCALHYQPNTRIDGVATLRKQFDISTEPSCRSILYLEHVVIIVHLNFTFRRNIEMTLVSPMATKSIMLRAGRFRDVGKDVTNLSLKSLHHWGENPKGIWNLEIRNVIPTLSQSGFLFRISLQLFGTSTDPMEGNQGINSSKIVATTTSPTTRPSTDSHSVPKITATASPTDTNAKATNKRIILTEVHNYGTIFAVSLSMAGVVLLAIVIGLIIWYKKRPANDATMNSEHAMT